MHLGALSNDPIGDLSPQSTYDINQHASVRLARAAKQAGVQRFLYASTCSVYGASGSDLVTESAELRPVTAYAIKQMWLTPLIIFTRGGPNGGYDLPVNWMYDPDSQQVMPAGPTPAAMALRAKKVPSLNRFLRAALFS